jgi:hypothetical protein
MGKLGLVMLLAALLMAGSLSALWYDQLTIEATVDTAELDFEFYGQPIWLDACGLPPGPGFFGGWDWMAFPPSYEEAQSGVNAYINGELVDGKDVGCTNVSLSDTDSDGDMDTMDIWLNNTYPYYYTKVDFEVHNNGEVPIKIWRLIVRLDNGSEYYFYEINSDVIENEGMYLDLDGDGLYDVIMWWGDNFGVQLEPCQRADISFNIIVLQTAKEGMTYHFQLQLDAVQWNEYQQGPIGG